MPENEANWSEDLPEMVKVRATEYLGYGVPKSQAKATAMRDLGYQNKEIAEALDVTPDAASSYYSKFNLNLVNETVRLALAAFGGPKYVRGWNMIQDDDNDKEYWYVMKPVSSEADIEDARAYPPEGEFTLVKIRADERTFNAESTVYDSLDALADDIYRNAKFDDLQKAHEVHGMLTESGIRTDALEDPDWKVNQN